MKYISDKEILKLKISPLTTIEWVKSAFLMKKNSDLPAKTSIRIGETNYFNTMPALIPPKNILGVKVINRFINRTVKVDGQIFIYNYENGYLEYMLDAFWITTARTGAVCALAYRTFSSSNANTIGLMGLGNTAIASLSCILEDNINKDITVKLLQYKNQCEDFIKLFSKYKNVHFEICSTIKALIKNSDVIISCITNTNNLLAEPEWFKEGSLIIPVHTKGFQNCDSIFDKIYGDDTNNIKHFKYFNQYKKYAEITEVLSKTAEGRKNDKERIISYNLGIAMHDLIFAKNIIDLIEKESKENTPKTILSKFDSLNKFKFA